MSATAQWQIVVGEVGNEVGHVSEYTGDEAGAIRKAKAEVKPYKGDGWYLVRDAAGQTVASGGRRTL